MTLKQLLDLANSGYPEGRMSEYYDEEGRPKENPDGGDTLAEFVVRELHGIFDESDKDDRQRRHALHALSVAICHLQSVIYVLDPY